MAKDYEFHPLSETDLPSIDRWLRAPRVITDPDPANRRAVRAYEKAGFVSDQGVDTPHGRTILMVCHR